MTKSMKPAAAKPALTLNKEKVVQLKVRTDLKGGALSSLAARGCGSSCHCMAAG